MKNILGHRSWNEEEVLAFFDKGSFTMCRLPHYRYQRVQRVCAELRACGLIEKVGGTETSVNYVAKPEYHQWRKNVAAGTSASSLRKLLKIKNAPKLLKRACLHCNVEFETFNHQQKFCTRQHNMAFRDWKPKGKDAA
jgi:hypothetical protein